VHAATPLSPMEPRNSTPAVSQPFVKRDSRPECREVATITDRLGRVGHRSHPDPRQTSADTHPARASGNEVSEGEARDGEHVYRLRNRVADRPDLVDGAQSWRVEDIRPRILEGPETSDRVFELGMAADVVLGSRR